MLGARHEEEKLGAGKGIGGQHCFQVVKLTNYRTMGMLLVIIQVMLRKLKEQCGLHTSTSCPQMKTHNMGCFPNTHDVSTTLQTQTCIMVFQKK
jgi:hypothetical protein